jgi:Spy/CpxP family protein refolding chaperone
MEKKAKIISVITTAAMFLGSAAFSFAQQNPQASGQNAQMQQKSSARQEKFLNGLNLTAEQKEKIKSHREANKEKMTQLHQQLREKRQALKAEFDKAALDKGKIKGLVEEIKSLANQMLESQTDNLIFLKETLTPEQFAKFRQKMEKRKGQMQDWKVKERK